MAKLRFEFVNYGEDAAGAEVRTIESFVSDAAAKGAAGRLAKRIKGPVDIARAGSSSWNNRYLTTAAPSEYHASGFRFERLDS